MSVYKFHCCSYPYNFIYLTFNFIVLKSQFTIIDLNTITTSTVSTFFYDSCLNIFKNLSYSCISITSTYDHFDKIACNNHLHFSKLVSTVFSFVRLFQLDSLVQVTSLMLISLWNKIKTLTLL